MTREKDKGMTFREEFEDYVENLSSEDNVMCRASIQKLRSKLWDRTLELSVRRATDTHSDIHKMDFEGYKKRIAYYGRLMNILEGVENNDH